MITPHQPFRTNFYMWRGVAALFFSSWITEPHSHNTMQLFIDLQDGFRCKFKDGSWERYRLLILRENVIHQLDTDGSVQLLIYLDAGSSIAHELKNKYLKGSDAASPNIPLLSMLHPGDLQHALLEATPQLLWKQIVQIFDLLTGVPETWRGDERVAKAEQLIAATPAALLSIKMLASAVCLSESRFRAVFKRHTGISVYQYLLWARLRCGISQLMAGKPVRDAAVEAGFSDSSHFHKMLVQMFGVGPGAFLKNNRKMQMVSCDETAVQFETNIYDRNGRLRRVYH
jgi:AraC-like DNA-binding protein